MKAFHLFLLVALASFSLAFAKPTVYMKNSDSKLTPVLVPISSTVIPLPIYRVSFNLGGTNTQEESNISYQDKKLITAKTKKYKKEPEKVGASVKLMSREDFEKKASEI